jgi:uncharacterized membrane protein YebE (DUF533 family)
MTTRYNFLAYMLYGSDAKRQREIPVEARDLYARAILTIAAADGLSDRERDYFVNLARALEMPDEVAEGYAKYDTKSASLEQLLKPLKGMKPVPYLVYDAIKIASVDGYSDKERAAVRAAAEALGVAIESVRALEALVVAENGIREARLAIFAAMEGAAD